MHTPPKPPPPEDPFIVIFTLSMGFFFIMVYAICAYLEFM